MIGDYGYCYDCDYNTIYDWGLTIDPLLVKELQHNWRYTSDELSVKCRFSGRQLTIDGRHGRIDGRLRFPYGTVGNVQNNTIHDYGQRTDG